MLFGMKSLENLSAELTAVKAELDAEERDGTSEAVLERLQGEAENLRRQIDVILDSMAVPA